MSSALHVLVLCFDAHQTASLTRRLAPFLVDFAESADQLLERAGAQRPEVVVLAPETEEDVVGMAKLAADLRSSHPEVSVLVVSENAEGVPDGDAVLDPNGSDEELMRTCGLLGKLASLRVELAETTARLETERRHRQALNETHQHELQRLNVAAFTDELTGVANRRHWELRLGALFDEAKRHKQSLGVAVFDLDHFKSINETFGHEAGDLTLRAFAEALNSSLRQGDLVGRMGGDEFVLLLPQLAAADLLTVGNRLHQYVTSRSVVYEGQTIGLLASGGLSAYPDDGSTEASELLRHADLAMLEAKRQGRNQVCIWES